MNTKLSFALLVIVIALIATACTPVINAVQPMDDNTSVVVPVTGSSAPVTVRAPQESRLWSGPIFTSDNGSPDYVQNAKDETIQPIPSRCMSEDSLPRRRGGCME